METSPEWPATSVRWGRLPSPPAELSPSLRRPATPWDGQPTTKRDTSGSVTSTTTLNYDPQDRPVTVSTQVTGTTSSATVPPVTTTYDQAGRVVGTTSTAGTTALTYDKWGRELTYSNHPAGQPAADTATTTYNALGQVVSVVDDNGTTRYIYDGLDASGQPEYRGLVTSVETHLAGNAAVYSSAGSYDHAGHLILERLPGKIIRRTFLNSVGEETGLTYHGDTVVDGQYVEDQPWLAWASDVDIESEIVRESTPLQTAAGADGINADRTYTYDQAGRLTRVDDRSTRLSGSGPACTTRIYRFDVDSNRTSQSSVPGSATGDCATTGGETITWSYDAAGRVLTGGNGQGTYVYDELGRQTTIPAADAPNPDRGDINLAYCDNDTARTITQGEHTIGFTLDGVGRRLIQHEQRPDRQIPMTDLTNTLTRHYVDGGDNSTWSVDERDNTTTTTRYAELVGGELDLTYTTTVVDGQTPEQLVHLQLASPRGDIATTVKVPSQRGAAIGIDAWADYTEYGQPTNTPDHTAGSTTGIGYGWLGNKQRSTTETGLILMGARLYNPSSGLFTSLDPVYGGNLTPYGYPVDPVNSFDISGEAIWIPIILACVRFCYKAYKVARWAYKGYKASRGVRKAVRYGKRAYRRTVYGPARPEVYRYKARNGRYYVGQSNNIQRRMREHYRAGNVSKWRSATGYRRRVSGPKARREVFEQRLLDRTRNGRWRGRYGVNNKKNPIGPRRQRLMSVY